MIASNLIHEIIEPLQFRHLILLGSIYFKITHLGRWVVICILRLQADFKNEWISIPLLYREDELVDISIEWLWVSSASASAACRVGDTSGHS